MRGRAIAVVLVAACAGGESGSSFTSFGGNVPTSSTTTSTSGASEGTGATTDGTTSESGSEGSTAVATSSADTSTGGSSDTGMALPCDEVLETFAVDPGWTPVGEPSGGTSFEWSATANAGGAAGEVGGTLQRAGAAQFFADTSIELAAGDCVVASGRLLVPSVEGSFNTNVFFGHFSSSNNGPSIGFSFSENDASSLRVFVFAGGATQMAYVMSDLGTQHVWSYAYDPIAGTMTFDLDGYPQTVLPVAPGDVDGLASTNAFGMFKGQSDNAGDYPGLLTLWLDEISYTR